MQHLIFFISSFYRNFQNGQHTFGGFLGKGILINNDNNCFETKKNQPFICL